MWKMKTCVHAAPLPSSLLSAHSSSKYPVRMSPYVLYGMEAINVDFYDRFQALYDPVQ